MKSSATANSEDSSQFNSSAPKLTSLQTGVGNSIPHFLYEIESYVTTDGQSASLSWSKASIWGLRPGFYYYQTVAGLLVCGALSDERTCLSFTVAADPCYRSHSPVRLPWDSWLAQIRALLLCCWTLLYNHFARTTQKTKPLLLRRCVYWSVA
jgi:hypothetical protein